MAIVFATSSFASIPRASMLDRASEDASALVAPLSETRLRVSEVLAPFERPAESELTRALRQAYEHPSTTNASGLRCFLSVDPNVDLQKNVAEPQRWNRYAYVTNNPLKYDDPDGRERRILLVGTNSASEMRLQAIQDGTVANSQGWSYDTYNSGYSLDVRHSLGGPSLLHALGAVDNSGTDIVVINSHGGTPLQTDTGGGRDGSRRFNFGATEIAKSLGGTPQAIILAGCGTMDSAQSVANKTGTVVFGVKSGAEAYASQVSRAGAVLANVYAAAGNANSAIPVANRMLTKQVCPMPEFQVARPEK